MEKSLKSRPRKKTRKTPPRHETYIKSYPRDGKTHTFRSAVLAKKMCFFDKMFMIRVAMGAVKIRIYPEASPFRSDAYFECPGAQKNHFLNTRTFLKICFKNMFRNKFFFGTYDLEKSFPEKWGLGSPFWVGGQARKMTPVIYPLVFKNFLVTKIVAVGATEIIPKDF